MTIQDFEKFGEVEVFGVECDKSTHVTFELKIGKGFDNTFESIMAIHDIIAPYTRNYPFIKKMVAKKDNYHLIITTEK